MQLDELPSPTFEGTVPVDKLDVDGDNPNEQSDEMFGLLCENMREHGWLGNAIVCNEDYVIADGEHRWRAAQEIGLDEVPVKTYAIDEPTRRLWRQELNKIGGEHDEESDAREYERLLRSDLSDDVYDLANATDEDIDELVKQARTGVTPPEVLETDYSTDDAMKANTSPGDLIQLGDHTLLCADSTHPDHVAAALGGEPADMTLTDPPYNITGSSTGLGDDVTDHSLISPFFEDVADVVQTQTQVMGHIYVFCDWRTYPLIWDTIGSQTTPKNLVVWDKNNGGLGSNYMNQHEFISFFHNYSQDPALQKQYSDRPPIQGIDGDTNLWTITREHDKDTADGEREHFAQKPVAVCTRAIQNSSQYGDTVLDPFGGSGSTLIACENTGRRCVMLEADPVFCDTIRHRWERLTGNTATKLDTPDAVDHHDPDEVLDGQPTLAVDGADD